MDKKLDWIDVLNEQVAWQSRADFRQWFSKLVGRQSTLMDASIDGFDEALGFTRRQIANLHFSEPVDLLWLDTQLKTVSIGLLHHQGSQPGTEANLPRCRARVKGMLDADLLRAVKDTLLIQFAEFVGNTLDCPDQPLGISRCAGVHRSTAQISTAASYPQEVERRWRAEIAILSGDSAANTDLVRCPMFFISAPKSRYCSDACKFATSQFTKQVEEPQFIAEKRRYRKRK